MSDDEKKKARQPVCRFGSKCYQKNPVHREKYRHPPKREMVQKQPSPLPKKRKLDNKCEDDKNAGKPLHNISDSEEDCDNPQRPVVETYRAPNKQAEDDSDSEPRESDSSNSQTSNSVASLIPSNIDHRAFIKEKFLVEMPDDFYQFWDLCKHLKSESPQNAFRDVSLSLIGPFDVLADKFCNTMEKSPDDYLLHWRYYYDPPEFQTVLKEDSPKDFHIGYFRDEPKQPPVFLASNSAKEDGTFEITGSNIFAAVYLYLEDFKERGDPFKRMHVGKFMSAVKKEAEKLNLPLTRKSEDINKRNAKAVTKTFNKCGLVVPYNKKTQLGYRELAMDNKQLKSILDKMKKALPEQMDQYLNALQPVFTYTSIAIDECDFGTGLELGWNILASGVDRLNATTARFLSNSYNLLKREEFAKIANAHMKNRKRGGKISILY